MGRLLWPALSEQWQQFMDQLPRLIDNVKGWLGDLQVLFGQWGATLPAPKTDDLEAVAGTVLANTVRFTAGAGRRRLRAAGGARRSPPTS